MYIAFAGDDIGVSALDSAPASARERTARTRQAPAVFLGYFMFQLSTKEFENWRLQIVISKPGAPMGRRWPPDADAGVVHARFFPGTKRYFWRRLLGFSGRVYSIRPVFSIFLTRSFR